MTADDGRHAPVTIEYVPADSIRPHPRNPNEGDVGAITESMDENGVYRSVTVQRSTGYILTGTHTWQAMRARGLDPVPVTFRDVDDFTALRIMLADNRTAQRATYDDVALLTVLKDVHDRGDLLGTGWTGDDIDDLLAKFEPQPAPEPDGEDEDDDGWPVVTVKVPPAVYAAWKVHVMTYGGDEAAALGALL